MIIIWSLVFMGDKKGTICKEEIQANKICHNFKELAHGERARRQNWDDEQINIEKVRVTANNECTNVWRNTKKIKFKHLSKLRQHWTKNIKEEIRLTTLYKHTNLWINAKKSTATTNIWSNLEEIKLIYLYKRSNARRNVKKIRLVW